MRYQTMTKSRRLRTAGVLAAAAAAALLAIPTSAFAMGTVDQQQPLADGSIVMPPGIAQTFTVGRAGMLDGLTLMSPGGGTINYQLYAVRADGTPDTSHPYLAQNAQASLMPGVSTDIALPASIPVTAGQKLALGIGTIRSYATMDLATGSGDPYPAGDLYQVVSVSSFTPVTGVDLQFSTHVTSQWATSLALQTLRSSSGRPTATLTYGSSAAALAGKTVSFSLLRSDGTVKSTCSATSDSAGVARCASVRWKVPSGGSMQAAFAGDATYLASSATVTS